MKHLASFIINALLPGKFPMTILFRLIQHFSTFFELYHLLIMTTLSQCIVQSLDSIPVLLVARSSDFTVYPNVNQHTSSVHLHSSVCKHSFKFIYDQLLTNMTPIMLTDFLYTNGYIICYGINLLTCSQCQ